MVLMIWDKPVKQGIWILLQSHQLGLNYGDHEFTYFAAINYIACLFYQSRPLQEIEQVCEGICTKMEECIWSMP
jgi:hypothetical protein